MRKILGVRFREIGKIHYFIYSGDDIRVGDTVVAETKRGIECGKVMIITEASDFESHVQPSEVILRKATKEDLESLKEKEKEEKEAGKICKQKILEHKLKMKLIDVEYMFNRNKIIFYFVSESRIDFRNLVKELARVFKVRIELRQVGIRDEAKILGGLGSCGKMLCCSTFLNDFQPVSIKMAKDQGMSLSPSKLSGTCGRLMCCLKYEQDVYRDIMGRMPRIGTTVLTPDGPGTVTGQNIIAEKIKVTLDADSDGITPKFFATKEIKPLKE